MVNPSEHQKSVYKISLKIVELSTNSNALKNSILSMFVFLLMICHLLSMPPKTKSVGTFVNNETTLKDKRTSLSEIIKLEMCLVK